MRDWGVDTPTGSLAVRDHGGEGPAVVLLHGAGHNLEVWRDVVAAIDGRCRAVAVDLRGHGRSAVVDSFSMADLAADVHHVCRALDLKAPVLVGHSLGGWAALAAAALGGVRALVSIEGPVLSFDDLFRGLGLPPDRGEGGEETLRAQAFHGDDAAWAKRLSVTGSPGSIARAVAERGRVRLDDGLLHSHPLPHELISAQRCAWEIDPAILYPRLGIPVTIVLATDQSTVMHADRFVDLRDAAVGTLVRVNPMMKVVRLAGGHHLPVERASDIAEIVVAAIS